MCDRFTPPLLFAWVGGPHFSVGIGIGEAVEAAWPGSRLGRVKFYEPSYHVSRTYVQT